MAKVTMEEVINAANVAGITGESRKVFLEKLEMFANESASTKGPRRKHEHVVVIKGEGIDVDKLTAAVFTIPQDADPATLLDSVKAAAVDQNTARNKKSKKPPIKTFTDSLLIKAKHQKERNYKTLTKEPCRVLLVTPAQDDSFILPSFGGKKDEDFS